MSKSGGIFASLFGGSDQEVLLKEHHRVSREEAYDDVATVYYDICLPSGLKVGNLDLRLTMNDYMYYYGHIGYHVYRFYRGHNYAYKACRKVFQIAKEEFGMEELIITCCPDNLPSLRTLEKLGGELIETVDVPRHHELWLRGEKVKCIFKYKL